MLYTTPCGGTEGKYQYARLPSKAVSGVAEDTVLGREADVTSANYQSCRKENFRFGTEA
ncbi:hypothetical protein PHLCEN_2v12581 [Hermanssonia centrifuga]|uniref:Uncharacterized protein n=1 Tax=Hermanssonia centrifuga TaxID=98765 RepID=A0A2R6NGL4_9APHY|nr:hypothetical protein PHLCEN_2v12581 [Hermanssonia centrifuga]